MGSKLPSEVPPGVRDPGCGTDFADRLSVSLLSGMARVSASLLGARLGIVTVGAEGGQRLRAHSAAAGSALDAREVAALEELCGRVAEGEGPVLLESGSGWGTDAFLGAPVRVRGRAVGALAVVCDGPRGWTCDDRGALGELAGAISAELERCRLEVERDALADALQRSETRYARLTRTSAVGIFTTDRNGRLTELNEAGAAMVGRPLAELIGREFRDVMAPVDLEATMGVFADRIAGRMDPAELEVRVVRPTGERRLLLLVSAPVVEDGAVVGVHGVARDVTEERAREMQFRRAERMASVAPLLSGVCHELNNPLTSIKSFAELLLLDDRSPEDREALEIVQREAHRAAKIVTDLRSVARQSQETGTERCMVDLNAAVQHVLESRSEGLAGVHLRVDLAEGLAPIWAVRLHVEQVVLQLISNAMQAMQEQPGARELTVRSYAGGLGVVLQVEDTGPGIAPDHLDRIFDPFWTTRRPGEGTGLGLSLVSGIVEDHGGRIRVDSTPGLGTGFAVEFPVALKPAVGAAQAGIEASAGRQLRILVVDDEAAIRYSLTRYMERRGHAVEEASEGGAALRLLDAMGGEPFDVIVADLRMPGLNGGELLRRLRERGGGLEDRLIFITGDSDSSDLENGIDYRGIPVVQKPFELAEIAQVIEAQPGMALR